MNYSRAPLTTVAARVEIGVPAYRPEGCRIWSIGNLPIVSLPAEIDIANAHLLRSALQKVCSEGSVVVADMTITTLLTAAGIGVLAPIGKRMQDSGGELLLVVSNAKIRFILEVLKLDGLFRIFTTLSEALAADHRDSLPCDRAA